MENKIIKNEKSLLKYFTKNLFDFVTLDYFDYYLKYKELNLQIKRDNLDNKNNILYPPIKLHIIYDRNDKPFYLNQLYIFAKNIIQDGFVNFKQLKFDLYKEFILIHTNIYRKIAMKNYTDKCLHSIYNELKMDTYRRIKHKEINYKNTIEQELGYVLKNPYSKEEIERYEKTINVKIPEYLKYYLINISRQIEIFEFQNNITTINNKKYFIFQSIADIDYNINISFEDELLLNITNDLFFGQIKKNPVFINNLYLDDLNKEYFSLYFKQNIGYLKKEGNIITSILIVFLLLILIIFFEFVTI